MSQRLPTSLPINDIDEVRRRALSWAAEHHISYAEIARRSHLTCNQVADFMGGRTASHDVVAHLVYYLPLELVYHCPRISGR